MTLSNWMKRPTSLGPSRERRSLSISYDAAVGFSPSGRGIAYPAPKPPQRLYPYRPNSALSRRSKFLFMSEARTSSCPHCCQPMKLVHTIPPLSPTWPAILAFYCAPCQHAETKEGCAAIRQRKISHQQTPESVPAF